MTSTFTRATVDNIPTERVRVIDSGDKFADRYTAVVDNDYDCAIFMSANPYHPQGVGMHGDVDRAWFDEQAETMSVDVATLPEPVRRLICADLNWSLDHPA